MDLVYNGVWFLPSSKTFPNGLLAVDDDSILQGKFWINHLLSMEIVQMEWLLHFSDVMILKDHIIQVH